MEKITDEQLKKELAFDQYARYAIIRNTINANRKDGVIFKVLDVGGRENILQKFLPGDDVFYLDPFVESDDANFIKGDGCAMPLGDESFDWVVSADVFEHIPPTEREKFLSENLRVAKNGAILAAPFFSEETEKAEKNANENYKILSGGAGNFFLEEHLGNKLPKEEDVENFLKKENVDFQKLYNNNIFLWEFYVAIVLNFIELKLDEEFRKEYEEFNHFCNSEVFPFDFSSPAYRRIYFMKKREGLNEIGVREKSIGNELFLKAMSKGTDFLTKVNKKNAEKLLLKDQEIGDLTQSAQKKDRIIQQKTIEVRKRDCVIEERDAEIMMMRSSKFWQMRKLYMRVKYFRFGQLKGVAAKGFGVLKEKGLKTFLWSLYKYILHGRGYFQRRADGRLLADYAKWIGKNEQWDEAAIKEEIKSFKNKPKISIITPVYNVDPKWLDKCVESVKNQFYENWELCLHDDASTKKETLKCLKKWGNSGDSRIKISFGKENLHISRASNEALKLATGEFVALLDNDDELSPDALFENVKILNKHPKADFVFSDEDKIEKDGARSDPFFKPDWSLHWFLTTMYTCHFGVYRKSKIDEIGGFRKGYEGAQDYDLVLRFIEKTDQKNIHHIPKILYHWRKIEGSTAQKSDSKNYAQVAAKKALVDYVRRNNISGSVEDGIFPGAFRLKRNLENHPLVSIIIPTKDKVEFLKPCVLSILEKTDYPNIEIIILDTGSKESVMFEFYDEIRSNEKIRTIDYPIKEFNFAEANTWTAEKAKGEYLLFLNNDTEVVNAEWLSSMMEYAQFENVGAVGPKLLFPNNTVQHMGIAIGLRGGASHAGILFPEWQLMGFPFLHAKDVARNVSAVTGACLLMRKKLFEKVGGFDKTFKIAFNDTDLCLKLEKLGYEIVYTPYAKLLHYESVTFGRPYENPGRSTELFEKERDIFNEKWGMKNFEDPFYNKNLTLKDESLSLKI